MSVHTARLAAITASSLRCPGQVSRITKPTPLNPTAEYHRSSPTDDEFHASIRPLGSSPNCMSLAFSLLLNRLRFTGSLHCSPSIQLHLQHDFMVDDQSTPAPHRLQAPCIHHLESIPRHSLVETTQALRPAPRVSTPQKSVTISITLRRRRRRSHHRLLYQPTRVDASDCLVQPSRTSPTATTRSGLKPSPRPPPSIH